MASPCYCGRDTWSTTTAFPRVVASVGARSPHLACDDGATVLRSCTLRRTAVSLPGVPSPRRRLSRGVVAASGRQDNGSDLTPGSPLPLVLPERAEGVPYSEASRRYRRTVYKYEDWLAHRSPTRLFANLRGLLTSGVVRSLLTEVGTVTAVSACVVAWNAVAGGYLDLSFHSHPSPFGDDLPPDVLLRLPPLPFTLASPALGLLLVFRTNTSYARWLEARVAWGRIVAHLRNLQRQPAVWMDADVGGADRAAHLVTMRNACWTFACALQAHLGGPEEAANLEMGLRARLPAAEADDVLRASHRPLRALGRLSAALNALPIDEKRRAEADKSIVKVGEATETCERIFSSPVPLVYTRHTARFLSAWLLLLPLGLWDQFAETWNHIGTIPAAAMAAIFLFGIEELAVQLEEPFSILPLDHLCEGVWEAAEQLHGAELIEACPHNPPTHNPIQNSQT